MLSLVCALLFVSVVAALVGFWLGVEGIVDADDRPPQGKSF